MNRKSLKAARLLVLPTVVMLGALSACATNETPPPVAPPTSASQAPTQTVDTPPALSGTLNAGGASSMTAAQEAWRADFQNANSGVTINYDPTGSGTGRTNFSEGGYVFAGTDAAFSVEDASGDFAGCVAGTSLVEIPAYISPIAVAFNLGEIKALNLDAATISELFAGVITNWNDPKIAAQNPDVTLPDQKVTPVHRADKSGTTQNFTDYLSKVAPAAWPYEVEETWPEALKGEAVEKTQGVREAVSSTLGAVGYLDASQAKELGQVAIKVGDDYVAYSPQAAALAVEKSPAATGRAATDIVINLDRTLAEPGAYPMVLISYLAACSQYSNSADGALVNAYLSYVVSPEGQNAAAANAGSAPLSGSLATQVAQVVSAIK